MKTIIIALLCVCATTYTHADTNIIAMSDWSQPIKLRHGPVDDQYIRGRLLIIQGREPAYGGPPTNGAMTFVELQKVYGHEAIEVCFDVMKLNCQLTDGAGKESLELSGGIWGGRGPFPPVWVVLPYNSMIRLYVNGGSLDPLMVYPNGEPWSYWSISSNDTNEYYLAGSLILSTHSNLNLISPRATEMDYKENRTATLEFPRFRVSPK